MVQIDIENFSGYRIVTSGHAMPAGDKQQTVAAKKVSVRELLHESQNFFMMPTGNLPIEKDHLVSDVATAHSNKRKHSSYISTPSHPLPSGSTGPKGLLVYVRRKLNREGHKISHGHPAYSIDPSSSAKTSHDECRGSTVQHDPMQEATASPSEIASASRDPLRTSSGEQSLVKPVEKPTETVLPEMDDSVLANYVNTSSTTTCSSDGNRKLIGQHETAHETMASPSEMALAPQNPLNASSEEKSLVSSPGKLTETVLPKAVHSATANSAGVPSSTKTCNDVSGEQVMQHEPTRETMSAGAPSEIAPAPQNLPSTSPKGPSPVSYLGKPAENVPPSLEHSNSDTINSAKSREHFHRASIQETNVSPLEIAAGSPKPSLNTFSGESSIVLSPVKSTEAVQTEPNCSITAKSADPPSSRKASSDESREVEVQHEPLREIKVSPSETEHVYPTFPNTSSGEASLLLSLGKPTKTVLSEPYHSVGADAIAHSPCKSREQDWKSRFLQLQMFLKKCDQSNQEEYVQKLRALPAVGRSRHAIELEKRAIKLSMEEAKEYQKMRNMGVIGKESSTSINVNLDQFL